MLFATGKLNAMPVTVGSMDFSFFGASVSPSVGECFLSGVQPVSYTHLTLPTKA